MNSEEIVARLTPTLNWREGAPAGYQAIMFLSDKSVRLYRYSRKTGWEMIDVYNSVIPRFRPFTWKYLD